MLKEIQKFSIKQIANNLSMTTHGILVAIYRNRLKATKEGNRWVITLADLNEYRESRFDRKLSIYRGKPLFDPEKGEISVKEAVEKYGIDAQSLYYALKKKYIPAKRKRCTWIIQESDVKLFKKLRRRKCKRYEKYLPLKEVV